MIITVGGVKGGIGKTTISTNLAVMRQAFESVVLVDADEQRSASEFAEQRKALGNGDLHCVQTSGGDTLLVVRDLAERYKTVIVDAGGRDTHGQRAALLASSLVLFPFPPGNYDAWTLPIIEKLVTTVRQSNKALDAVAFVNRGYVRGPDNTEVADMLRASTVLRFQDTPVLERRVLARSAGDGLAVAEVKGASGTKAYTELMTLYSAVFSAANAVNAA